MYQRPFRKPIAQWRGMSAIRVEEYETVQTRWARRRTGGLERASQSLALSCARSLDNRVSP